MWLPNLTITLSVQCVERVKIEVYAVVHMPHNRFEQYLIHNLLKPYLPQRSYIIYSTKTLTLRIRNVRDPFEYWL